MPDGQPKRIGRPPEPVPEDKAERILDALYGGRSLTAVCAEEGITPRAVSYWKAKDPVFASDFARARNDGAAFLVDEAQDLADKATPENVQVVKLQCDMRLKRAACFDPQHFGTKPDTQSVTADAMAKVLLEQLKAARSTTPLEGSDST